MFDVMVLLWTGGANSGTLIVPEHAAVLACMRVAMLLWRDEYSCATLAPAILTPKSLRNVFPSCGGPERPPASLDRNGLFGVLRERLDNDNDDEDEDRGVDEQKEPEPDRCRNVGNDSDRGPSRPRSGFARSTSFRATRVGSGRGRLAGD
jgi:hypothetical protein